MKTPIGIDKDSKEIRLISEVDSGLKCNCICPACESLLVAKKGPKKADHFSHHHSKEGPACRETAIHLMAKYTILRQSVMIFPTLAIRSSERHSLIRERFQELLIHFNDPQRIYEVKEEVSLSEYKIKPDILCKTDISYSSYNVAIEIAVTHEVDDIKRDKFESANLSAYEIDLSDLVHKDSISFKDIEEAIQDRSRIKWIHVSDSARKHIEGELETENQNKLEERDNTIRAWHQWITNHLAQTGQIRLPLYKFNESDSDGEVVDISGRKHSLSIQEPPTIGGVFSLLSVRGVEDGSLTLNLYRNHKEHDLPVVLSIGSARPAKPKGSFLHIERSRLPTAQEFEKSLTWGNSIRADSYKTKVIKLRNDKADIENRKLKTEIHKKITWLKSIQSGEAQPEFNNIDHIHHDYMIAKCELEAKGYNTSKIITNIPNGWIFGCPNEYWQIILFRNICKINNDGVDVRYYHDNLKKYHGIQVIQQVRSLSFLKVAAVSLGHDGTTIPSGFKVLSDYFKHLAKVGAISRSWSGKDSYKKIPPYGDAYQALNASTRSND